MQPKNIILSPSPQKGSHDQASIQHCSSETEIFRQSSHDALLWASRMATLGASTSESHRNGEIWLYYGTTHICIYSRLYRALHLQHSCTGQNSPKQHILRMTTRSNDSTAGGQERNGSAGATAGRLAGLWVTFPSRAERRSAADGPPHYEVVVHVLETRVGTRSNRRLCNGRTAADLAGLCAAGLLGGAFRATLFCLGGIWHGLYVAI